jgi:hypothetical protein
MSKWRYRQKKKKEKRRFRVGVKFALQYRTPGIDMIY